MTRATATPLLIGPANAAAVVGAPWRWVRDTARALGVRFVGHGRKAFVPAAEFFAALERTGADQVDAPELDPAEAVRTALGRSRRMCSPKEEAGKLLDSVVSTSEFPANSPRRASPKAGGSH